MTPPKPISLEEMIEAVEWEVRGVQIGLASHVDPELAELHKRRLEAAAATLRRVKDQALYAPAHKCGYPIYGGKWPCGNLVRGDRRCYRHKNMP